MAAPDLKKPDHPEIGRTLSVNELQVKQVVWLQKSGRPAIATMWVTQIHPEWVTFYSGVTRVSFLARRCGDGITDDDGLPFAIYEYLGKP
jgi:hypothetical protein